jgi:hypothetical protein
MIAMRMTIVARGDHDRCAIKISPRSVSYVASRGRSGHRLTRNFCRGYVTRGARRCIG